MDAVWLRIPDVSGPGGVKRGQPGRVVRMNAHPTWVRGALRERDAVRGLRMVAVLAVMALPGCAAAVVTGGAIVADEVIEQVEGGGDGLF